MSLTHRRIPLTPYDRMFLASHQVQVRAGLPGHSCLAELELHGELDARELRERFERVVASSPILGATIGYTRLDGRAHWKAPLPDDLIPAPFAEYELSAHLDPDAVQQAIMLRAWRTPRDPHVGPHVQMLLFHRGPAHYRLVLVWPHYLMDMEGARLLLRAVGSDDPTGNARHDHEDYPATWRGRVIRGWASGTWRRRCASRADSCRLHRLAPASPGSADFVMHSWPEFVTTDLGSRATAECASGPLLLTRYFLISLIRAMDDLHESFNFHEGPHYLLPLPMRLPRTQRRMITSNDLTIATLWIDRRIISLPGELDRSLCDQIARYRAGGDEADWSATRYAGILRHSHYEWMMGRRTTYPRYTMGFTSYRCDPWDRPFLGCHAADLHGCALPTNPPGVLVSFCRYGDRLTTGAGYFTHYCSTPQLNALLDRMHERLGIPAAPWRRLPVPVAVAS